jgi:accessory gene regulator protein AgrB
MIAIDVVAAVALVAAEIFTVRKCKVEAAILSDEEQKSRRKKAIITTGVILVLIVILLICMVLYIDSQMIGESVFDYIFH